MRTKQLTIVADTIQLDSLSIIPGSFSILSKRGIIDTSFYKINYVKSILVINKNKLKQNGIDDSLTINYKVFPYLFSSVTKHKDVDRIRPNLMGRYDPFNYTIEEKESAIFKTEGLNKSGSISRGISFGNNQDVVLNSNLDLQLSGKLSNNIDLLLAATDNNIPIQTEGNTQQLQEFDKVFIQLANDNTKLIAGDFQMTRPSGYFMNFNKKAQGISFSTTQNINKSADTINQKKITSSLSAAVSRGKFARNQIQGIENNQGPYRLRGAENELFIIILSGTEKIYIDGKLMIRGQENDYVIDYNSGEVIFTAKQLITKDKRIVIEFQYSDKNYARSLVHFANDYEQNKMKFHFNIYSEQDNKNKPLQQSLTADQKNLLSKIGDSLSLAVTPSVISVPYNNNEVLYKKVDTTIGSYAFKNIFLYGNSADSVHYRVTFSNVGQGNGNYIQVPSAANGKVFKWVLPDTLRNIHSGNYEPIIQLITPKKKQMLTTGIDYKINKNTSLFAEAAVSNNDINTFSTVNKNNNIGYGLKLNLDNSLPLTKTDSSSNSFILHTNVNYEFTDRNFSPIERFRSIEFERDWNRAATLFNDQHIIGAGVSILKKDLIALGYKFNGLIEGTNYYGNKHMGNFSYTNRGSKLFYDGSLLNSISKINTNFYRHKSGISQKIKWFTIGLSDEFEQNKFLLPHHDSLQLNSYKYWEWQAYATNTDTTKNRYGLSYKQRTDYVAKKIENDRILLKSAFAQNYAGFFELLHDQNNQLKVNATYRRLQIADSALTSKKPDNSLVTRVEYNLSLWKELLYSNTYYEIGSGLEIKKEYSYIQVAAGQGTYTWIDYNNNGIKELNEFEVATFPDQALYIRVYTPTNSYIKTYSNQFSQTIMVKPAAIWRNKSALKKFIARFANQAAYRVDRKSTESDLKKAYNPFLTETNNLTLASLNSSFRNTLFINQENTVLGIDLTYQDIRNKSLLTNGFESRGNIYKEAKVRFNINTKFSLNVVYQDGKKASTSQYFKTRDYGIFYYEATPQFNYQPNTTFRATVSFKYADKKNKVETDGGQNAVIQDYGIEIKYNVLQKGSFNAKINFIQIKYNAAENTPLAFEMLESLKLGKNMVWGVVYQRDLSNNLQLSVTYDGRKSETSKIIHTGGAQVRASF
ncbi:MAG: hypothetical protein ABI315_00715 [Bacteroidia bacterium]